MTREEAINQLTYARQMADEEIQKNWCDALDMAIEALKEPKLVSKGGNK